MPPKNQYKKKEDKKECELITCYSCKDTIVNGEPFVQIGNKRYCMPCYIEKELD